MIKENKSIIGILFFTIFLNLTGFSIILPLSPALLDFYLPTQEASGGVLGQFVTAAKSLATSIGHEDSHYITSVFFGCLLASLYAFLQFLFSPIWGKISDRYGRRNILILTLLGTALSYTLWIFADTFSFFVLSRISAGIMAGNITVASAAMADITTTKNRTHGMALIGVAFGLGFLFGPAIGGLLTQVNPLDYFPSTAAWGINKYSSPAIAAAMLAFINIIWVIRKFPETFPLEKRTLKEKTPSMLESIQTQSPSIAKTNLSYFIFLLSFAGLEFTLAFLAAERFNYSPVNIGYLFLYIGFVLIVTQGYIIRKLTPIMGERSIAMLGMISGITAYMLIALSANQTVFFIGAAFLSLSVGFTTPSLSSLVSLYATDKTQGKNLGLFRSAGSLARAIGPMLAALIYFPYGATTAYIGVSSLLFIPLLVIFTLPDPKKDHPPEPSPETLDEEKIPSV